MATVIPGIELVQYSPNSMLIKKKNSHNMKIKFLAVDKNTEIIRVQGEKDRDILEFFARDIFSLKIIHSDPDTNTLVISFLSGININIFEVQRENIALLEAFRNHLLEYIGEFMRVKMAQ